MAVKVQGSTVPTIQAQQFQQDHSIVSPRDPASGLPTGKRVQDEFVGGILQPKDKVSLTFGDRVNASGLSKALSSPLNDLRLAFGKKTETITRDANGTYRGPEGQPLVPVKLEDGKTAYVDPNTNQHYLTDEQPDCHGIVHALPARDLPEGSQFSNSYFGDADVKELTRIANGGSIINFPPPPPIKWPPVRLDPVLPASAAKNDAG